MPSRKTYSTGCSNGKCKKSPVKKSIKKTVKKATTGTKKCKGKLQDGSHCNYSVAAGNKLYCRIHGTQA